MENIMKRTLAILTSVCLIGLYVGAEEDQYFIDSVSLGAGISRHNEIGISRFGVRKDSDYTFFKNQTGWLSGYYEASLGCWMGEDDTIYNAAFSPVFVYYFGAPTWKVQPYIEAGIGVSAISDTDIGNRNMSTIFQFEDRIGLGVKLEHVDVSIRYMHYSNGSIAQPNDGIDIFIATLGYRF
jgi:lipid A 3-O-deacylase